MEFTGYIIITILYAFSLLAIRFVTDKKKRPEITDPENIIAAPHQYIVNIIENTKDLSQIGFADLTLSLNEILEKKKPDNKQILKENSSRIIHASDIDFEELINIKTN